MSCATPNWDHGRGRNWSRTPSRCMDRFAPGFSDSVIDYKLYHAEGHRSGYQPAGRQFAAWGTDAGPAVLHAAGPPLRGLSFSPVHNACTSAAHRRIRAAPYPPCPGTTPRAKSSEDWKMVRAMTPRPGLGTAFGRNGTGPLMFEAAPHPVWLQVFSWPAIGYLGLRHIPGCLAGGACPGSCGGSPA